MRPKRHAGKLVLSAVLVAFTASSVMAQSPATASPNTTPERSAPTATVLSQASLDLLAQQAATSSAPGRAHPMWQDVLLGMGIGAGSGVILGAAWTYAQHAICTADFAVKCDSNLN